jgi:hypothetical protein
MQCMDSHIALCDGDTCDVNSVELFCDLGC